MRSARHGLPSSTIVAALAGCLLLALTHASPALAHAQLLGTSPASGSTVATQPAEVIFQFNQNVGGTAGAVRVYNAQGDEVDDLDVSHPDGNEHWMGVGLRPHLPDGTYTGTYRVISADTHIVYGGLVFSIGHPGAAPKYTVAGLIGRNEAGRVTKIAFGVVRALDYLSIALMIGGLLFMQAVWGPALGDLARPQPRWSLASGAFTRRAGRLLAVAVLLGLLVSLLGILLQGASGRRRIAVELAESHARRKHPRKSLRLGMGRARPRLAGARCAPARRPCRRQKSRAVSRVVRRDPGPRRRRGSTE